MVPGRSRGTDFAASVEESRQKLRKDRNRLAATEGAAFATASTLPELERAYEEFLQVEAANWKGDKALARPSFWSRG